MNSLDKIFNDLLKEVSSGGDKKKKKKKKRGAVKWDPPEAIVLVTISTRCRNCGAIHRHPNRRILGRRGRTTSLMKQWSDRYLTLPREIEEMEEYSDACEACFQGFINHPHVQDGSG